MGAGADLRDVTLRGAVQHLEACLEEERGMNFPEPIEDFLEVLHRPWKPVAAPAVFLGAFLYAWFLLYAFTHTGYMFFLDNVNLPIHEGGHLVFGIFGW